MGCVQLVYDWDWAARTPAFAKHSTWNPATPRPSVVPAIQAFILGRWNEAIDLTNQAIERDPLRPAAYSNLGLSCWQSTVTRRPKPRFARLSSSIPKGRPSTSSSGWHCSCRARPTPPCWRCGRKRRRLAALVDLPLVLHALGRRSESDASLAALKEKYAEDAAYQIAEVHAYRGEADLAFKWLERAYNQRDGGVAEIKGDRLMRGLIGDPRYKAFLRRLKLPE